MSYIINGTEVKVGQVWEQRNGSQCRINYISDSSNNHYFPIEWVSGNNDDSGCVTRHSEGCHGQETYSDLIRLISEPETLNITKEQTLTQTPNLQIEDLRKTAEEPQYKTWGDLPDGTFVQDDCGYVYVVNKYENVAAVSLQGGAVQTKLSSYRTDVHKIIKVKLQILE